MLQERGAWRSSGWRRWRRRLDGTGVRESIRPQRTLFGPRLAQDQLPHGARRVSYEDDLGTGQLDLKGIGFPAAVIATFC